MEAVANTTRGWTPKSLQSIKMEKTIFEPRRAIKLATCAWPFPREKAPQGAKKMHSKQAVCLFHKKNCGSGAGGKECHSRTTQLVVSRVNQIRLLDKWKYLSRVVELTSCSRPWPDFHAAGQTGPWPCALPSGYGVGYGLRATDCRFEACPDHLQSLQPCCQPAQAVTSPPCAAMENCKGGGQAVPLMAQRA